MKTSRIHFQRGQSTVEIMVAIFVFAIAMAGIAAVIFGNQFLSLDGEMNNTAIAKAQDLLEEQRANGKNNFNGVVNGAVTDGSYTKTVKVNDLNQCQKEVTSQIAWSTASGAPKQVTLTTLINNLAEELAHGGQCSGQNTVNPALTCPASVSSVGQLLDSGETLDNTFATSVRVKNNKIYVASSPLVPGDTGTRDFWVFDVTGTYLYSVNWTDSISTHSGGLNAMEIAGNYAYVASANGSAQLQIIDLNVSPPQVVGSLALTGNSSPAISIAYRSNKVYLGTASSAGPDFYVIDVSSPTHPQPLGPGYDVGGAVNKINVIGSDAYLTTSNSSKQVVELNVSNPGSITEVYSTNPSGSVGGQSLYFLGSKLYVGSMSGSNPNFNVLNLANFSSLGSAYLPTLESSVVGKPNVLLATGNLAFVGSSDSSGKFLALNVTNPSAPISCHSSLQSFEAPVTDMEFQNGLVYLVTKSNQPLKIIRLTY